LLKHRLLEPLMMAKVSTTQMLHWTLILALPGVLETKLIPYPVRFLHLCKPPGLHLTGSTSCICQEEGWPLTASPIMPMSHSAWEDWTLQAGTWQLQHLLDLCKTCPLSKTCMPSKYLLENLWSCIKAHGTQDLSFKIMNLWTFTTWSCLIPIKLITIHMCIHTRTVFSLRWSRKSVPDYTLGAYKLTFIVTHVNLGTHDSVVASRIGHLAAIWQCTLENQTLDL